MSDTIAKQMKFSSFSTHIDAGSFHRLNDGFPPSLGERIRKPNGDGHSASRIGDGGEGGGHLLGRRDGYHKRKIGHSLVACEALDLRVGVANRDDFISIHRDVLRGFNSESRLPAALAGSTEPKFLRFERSYP